MRWDDLQTTETWTPSEDHEIPERLPISIEGARQILCYSRESSERLLGIFGQEDQVIAWAEREGYEITGFARDGGITGKTPVDEREGLSTILRAVERPGMRGVAVRHLDRIARSVPIMIDAVERIWAADRDIFSCDLGLIPRGPAGRRLCIAVARAAEDENEAIVARLQGARRQKAARGGWIGGYRIRRRYGMKVVKIRGKEEYQPIPHEQEVIRRMCADREQGLGWKTIARNLNTEGVPTVTGAAWSGNAVRIIATRGPAGLTILPTGAPDLAVLSPPNQANRTLAL